MAKKQKISPEPVKNTLETSLDNPRERENCTKIASAVNELLDKKGKEKVNVLEKCGTDEKGCSCGGSEGGNPVGTKTDLIVLIDTSGSMGSSAIAVSNAVKKAIETAKSECEPDLKITFLGVDGIWSGTAFTQSHRDYITSLHGAGVLLAADTNHVGLKSEQGANAIEDLSKYADWREDACRAIFYISDEELDSIAPRNDFANETAVTNAAIAEANANNVTVFAHHLTYQHLAPEIIQNYTDLCHNTGGEVYFSSTPNVEEYVKLLTEVICNSCGKSVCKELAFPEIKPCITVKWGDSECDCLESSDWEVMTITVCNCYTNFSIDNFSIAMIQVLDGEGNEVPVLPDGTPSVKVHPVGVHCFGNIAPCECVTREFVVINEGARAGKYRLNMVGICFGVSVPVPSMSECFEFEVCKD